MRVDDKIEFTINGVTYKVKSKLTLGDWQVLMQIEHLDRVGGKLEWLSQISGCPVETLGLLSHSQFAQIFAATQGLLVKPDARSFHPSIEVEGETLHFVDMESISTAEFADLDLIAIDPLRDQRLHELLAILYRPAVKVGKRFKLEVYDHKACADRAEFFKEVPFEVAVGAANFFFEYGRASINAGLNSLMSQIPKGVEINLEPLIQSLQLPEIGNVSSWSSQVEILSNWTMQVESQLQELLTTLPTSETGIAQKRPNWWRLKKQN
jgi:hypothetical protein